MTPFRITLLSLALTIAAPARAQEAPATGGQAIGGIVDALGLRAKPAPAPDFVRNSRREGLEYVPFSPAPTQSRKKTPAEMQAVGSELDKAIAENKRKAARVKAPN
jgi:hypothetical protein